MTDPEVVAFLRRVGLHAPDAAAMLEDRGAECPDVQRTLFAPETEDRAIAAAAEDLRAWRAAGLRLLTVADDDYPENLRAVHDRPAAVFVAGSLRAGDERAVAIIGARRATDRGLALARELATAFVRAGVTVVSGLAAGIDTAAHEAAIAGGGHTIAVIGTGHAHAYPPRNASLQRRLGAEHLVVSPFWPDTRPDATTFRRRNGVMSGMSLATVIVEASARSGTRVQARLALAHGRPVFLAPALLGQAWASELARRPGVHVTDEAGEVLETVRALEDRRPPTA